jgi:hypothetical protein
MYILHAENGDELIPWLKISEELDLKITLVSNLDEKQLNLQKYDKVLNSITVDVPEASGALSCLKIVGCYRTSVLNALLKDVPLFGYHKFSFVSPAVNKAFEGLAYLKGIEVPYCVELPELVDKKLEENNASYFKKLFYKHIQFVTYNRCSYIICSENLKDTLMEKYKLDEKKFLFTDYSEMKDTDKLNELKKIIRKLKTKF